MGTTGLEIAVGGPGGRVLHTVFRRLLGDLDAVTMYAWRTADRALGYRG